MLSTTAVIALPGLAAPASAPAATKCYPRGAKVLRQTSTARVFSVRQRGPDGDRHDVRYACLKGRSLSYRLGYDECLNAGAAGSLGRGANMFRLAGPFVGFVSTNCEEPGEWDSVRVMDLRTGKLKYKLRAMQYTPFDPADYPGVTALVMARTGSVAWIACAFAGPECSSGEAVLRRDARGGKRLDYQDIDDEHPSVIGARSLRLRGSTVSWTRSGKRRSATLR